MVDALKGFFGTLALLGVLLAVPLGAAPAGADAALPDALPAAPYALWSPSYCSDGGGEWGLTGNYQGGTHVYLTGTTRSLSGSACSTPSTASAGTFAAQPKVLKLTGSSWGTCQNGPWEANAQGAWSVTADTDDLILGCGSGSYRLLSTHRITYGGTNQYAPTNQTPWLAATVSL